MIQPVGVNVPLQRVSLPQFGGKEVLPPIQTGLFDPVPDDPPAFRRFAVLGDAGTGKKGQMAVAEQMWKTYQQIPFNTVLVLGDNVYDWGEPRYFEARIDKPYRQLRQAGVKLFPILGNHDVTAGHGRAQLDYWGLPSDKPSWYQFSRGNVDFFALNTMLFLPNYREAYTKNPDWALKQAKKQLKWLQKALTQSKAKYKIVMGHYPLYSSGKHSTETEAILKLRKLLEPVLQAGNVDVYLAGDEHHYERTKPVKGIQYFVSGAGGRLRKWILTNSDQPWRDIVIARRHFMLFEETALGLAYQAISKKGKIIDSGLILPKRDASTGKNLALFA